MKALYRRAKANVGAWNPEEAKKDFRKCLELDKGLTKSVTKELDQLEHEIKMNEIDTKLKYQTLFK